MPLNVSLLRFLLPILLLSAAWPATAQVEDVPGEKDFDAGEMIMHHILDTHEIHFMTFNNGQPNESHLSVPLPIIAYDKQTGGVDMFSSSHLYHNPQPVEYVVNSKPVNDEVYVHENYLLFHEKLYKPNAAGGLTFDEAGHPTNDMYLDLSLTKNALGAIIAAILMLLIFGSIAKKYDTRKGQAPKGLQSLLEPLILFVRDEIAIPSIGKKYYKRYLPYLLTIFFFIWILNLLGLIPFIGGFNVTGNIAVTLVLALFTFFITNLTAKRTYWAHIFAAPGVPGWLLPLMIPIELLGVFTKPIVLCLRLFANITAGHIIILAFISLIFIFAEKYGSGAGLGVSVLSIAFGMFMNLIEVLVAFLQAYVFTLLSALYFGAAVEEHHHDDHPAEAAVH